MAEAIAPPNLETGIDVAVPQANNVLPSGLAAINAAVSAGGQNADANIAASNAIRQKITDDESGHINTKAQWGPVVANLLMRNYVGALNAYDGGKTEWIEGRTASGQKFYKQYNANGFTGQIANVDKVKLNDEEQRHVEENMGGIWTPRDQSVLQSGLFKGLQSSELSRITGLSQQVVGSMKTAYETNQVASRMNQGLTELDKLTGKLSGKDGSVNVLDLVRNAPADVREGIFRFKTGQQTSAKGKTGSEARGESGSSTEQKTGTVGGNIGKRIIGGNVSATETKSGTASENINRERGETSSLSAAGQEDIQSKILGYVQSKVKDPDQVGEVMRWVQLSQMINESQARLESSSERAPGVVSVAPTELGLTDSKSSFENNINLRRNNALEAAWSAFTANAVRQGRQNIGGDQLRQEFMDSNTYKGIKNMYDFESETNKTGKQPEIKEGTVHVDNRNRPVVYRGGKWEPVNVR